MEHWASRLCVENVDKVLKELSCSDPTSDQIITTASSGLDIVAQRWRTSRSLGTVQLLNALKQALFVEEPRLHYNYFSMHKRCIDILRLIQKKEDQKKEDHKFRQYFTSGYMPDDTLISNLPLLVLTVAQGSSIATQQMGLGSSGPQLGSRIVISCEDVMHEYLKTNGDRTLKELRTFCKNKSLGEARGFRIESKEYQYWFSLEEVIDPSSLAALTTGIRRA